MNKYVIDNARTCLGCKRPSCQKGCPVSTQIPEMIRLFLDGDIEKAGAMLFANNPLSVVCSIVCPHEKHCEGHCILNKKGAPVSVGSIENYISDFYINKIRFKKPESTGKNIAIIGSGPAGVSLAFIMAQKGHGVTIYEGNDKIGGVMRYGIPEFRLHKQILDTLSDRLQQLGVVIRPNIMIGKNLTLDELSRDGFDAVFIGTGVWSPRKLNIKGETLGNVHFAIDYLRNPEVYKLGNKVIVLGAGNVAMDVARTAVRHGVREVVVMYRKGEENMSAEKHEIECAKIDGVKFDFFKEPIELTREGVKYLNTDGSNTYGFAKTDSVFVAVSQAPRDLIVKNNKGIEVKDNGLLVTDDSGRTTKEGVFASGDVVTGARTVVEAVSFSKRVAEAMEEYFSRQNVTA
ncbi:MAG: NAD(P)-dependent oxidoreductase [Campylobacteraceae bacterium]|jgi:glutamate synthase (NADPH/NADH) small chain|nr:NAD(P)-dependent oxidoreductase [Campylobacteraceae bacterium]